MKTRSAIPLPALLLVGLTMAIVVGGIVLDHSLHQGINVTAIGLLTFFAFPVMGLLILRRQPGNAIGWLLLGIGLNIYVVFFGEDYAYFALFRSNGTLPFGHLVAWVSGVTWLPFALMVVLFLPLLFPTGRLLSSRWRLVIASGLIFALLAFVGNAFQVGSVSSTYPQLVNPLGMPGWVPVLQLLQTASLPFGLAAVLGSIGSVVVRYRRGGSLERRQLKWFLVAVVTAVLPFLLQGSVPNAVVQLLVSFLIPLLPISIAIAVLRHRLYDIDVVINRALVYGALAIFITAVYVGIVVGIGALIDSRGRPNLLLSILATAVVAVAFQPVRARVQALANRLVYGYRATPYEALTQFSHRVAGAYANEDVLPRLARVLADGTGAVATSVWIRRGDELTPVAGWPAVQPPLPVADADRAVEVRHQGETLGTMAVKKRSGEALTPVENKLINDLAAQGGQVRRNVRLASALQGRLDEISAQSIELRASRQRIVAVQDAERRRLERNIHDGAQQHLVALAVKLRLAATMAKRDPEKARRSVRELEGQTADALETLRDLAKGIYPPALRERGLVDALRSQVAVTADGVGRYDPEIEAGVYFCCLEALQNATKYAIASSVRIDLGQRNGELLFSVVDNGVGFDPVKTSAGTGIQNMKDRVASLGGSLRVDSVPGSGTTLRGVVPVLSLGRAARVLEPVAPATTG